MRCSAICTFVSINSFEKDDRMIRRVNLEQNGFVYPFYLPKDCVLDSEFSMGDRVQVEFDYFPNSKNNSNSSMFVRSIEMLFD